MENGTVELVDVALTGCSKCAFYIPYSTVSETTVVATRCEFANSNEGAVVTSSLASATFKNCVFHDNTQFGVWGSGATIHLHGDATAIHSNRKRGISAWYSSKVIIHLPSHHNTCYNNGGQDRVTRSGGTITNVED